MGTPRWHLVQREGVRLGCLDWGRSGSSVVLLHGIAGYAAEWAETASWLSQTFRVVAIEQRGHGRSEREPDDVSPSAFVADAEMWVEQLELAPAVVVGQSFGGLVAFLLASRRPEVVRALVIVEATPAQDVESPAVVRRWLESWPVPFASREAALAYFGAGTAWSRAWVGGLEERPDGLWPSFAPEVIVAALAEASRRDWWDDWARIRCPVLVVRGADGTAGGAAQRMVEALSTAQAVEVEEAGHDLHLEQPRRWRQVLEEFLGSLER